MVKVLFGRHIDGGKVKISKDLIIFRIFGAGVRLRFETRDEAFKMLNLVLGLPLQFTG